MQISNLSSREAVLEAIEECNSLGRDTFLKKYGYQYSRRYPLCYENQIYDSKAIAGVAYSKQFGVEVRPREFSGGLDTVVKTLRKLGFDATAALHPLNYLQKGRVYFRKDLVARFGGQLQSGIWTPREFDVVLLFSGESGSEFGYQDGWNGAEGVFRYSGEGQIGNMKFEGGNKAIRDHRKNNRDLLLFIDLGKGRGVRYEGLFECAGWDLVDGQDRNHNNRQMIIFDLVPVDTAAGDVASSGDDESPPESLQDLRKLAYDAATASEATRTKTSDTRRRWYERSRDVRRYVLARANGVCESCGCKAPFLKKDGTPYLEPHHTTRLADDGPDHPNSVGAVCPTCHRRIHSGSDGSEWNNRLKKRLLDKEEHGEA